MNFVLYKTCPHSYEWHYGDLGGDYCGIPVKVGNIYCNGHSHKREHPKITVYMGDSYLDGHSNFVFTRQGTTIIILGVVTLEGLIPLNEKQIWFAESRGWIVDTTMDIKDPGIE
jgi:hypothetical protein